MKKSFKKVLLFIAVFAITASVYGQAEKVLNLGGLGTGLYAGVEFPVGSAITVGPAAYTDWNFDKFVIAAKGNYYFDDLFGLPAEWDVYLGANVGYRIDKDNDGFNWGAQIGGRWFWSDKWGLNAEFGGGSGVNGGIGVTMKF